MPLIRAKTDAAVRRIETRLISLLRFVVAPDKYATVCTGCTGEHPFSLRGSDFYKGENCKK